MEEFYPMPLFIKLDVADVARSARWYADALGFRTVYAMPGEAGEQAMSHIRRARNQDLMLVTETPADRADVKGQGVSINLSLDADIQALAARVRASGSPALGPEKTAWNTFQLTVNDPDGYQIIFSQVADSTLSFDQVMPPDASMGSD